MIKKFFISLTLFLLILTGGLYAVLNSPQVTIWMARRWIEQYRPEYRVRSLTLAQQRFSPQGRVELRDFVCELKDRDASWKISGDLLSFDKIYNLAFSQRPVKIAGAGLHAAYGPYQATEISFAADAYRHEGKIHDVKAALYGGTAGGEIQLVYGDGMTYRIHLDFDQVDLQQLESVNPSVFSQVEGHVSGSLDLTGKDDELTSLQMKSSAPAGGKVRAALLQFITPYIPRSRQQKDLEALLKTDGKIPFEKISLHIKSLNRQKLSGIIRMESKKLNVSLNLPLDINLDGRLDSLAKFPLPWREGLGEGGD